MRGPIAHNRESRSTLREPKTIWIKQGNLNSLKYWESKSIFWEPETFGSQRVYFMELETFGSQREHLGSLKHWGIKDLTLRTTSID